MIPQFSKRSQIPNFKLNRDIAIVREGNQWMAIVGDMPITNEVGFGHTPSDALNDLRIVLSSSNGFRRVAIVNSLY